MKKKYQSEQLMVCHQDAEALYRIGAISDTEMREFDRECLVEEAEAPSGARKPELTPAYAGLRQP